MRRAALVLALLIAPCAPSAPHAFAGKTQDQLRSHWLGAWVIVRSEVSSDCAGLHTNNKVNGQLTLSRGARGFEPGELGKITGVDLKRSRVDVFVDLREDILVAFQDGPFELYREAHCRVELLVEVPRAMVKEKDVTGIRSRIGTVVERHVSLAEAEESDLWNWREIESYPADYERRLAEHAAWQATTRNETIDRRIRDSMESARLVLARVSVEREGYSEAFTHGVEIMSGRDFDDCEEVLAGTYDSWKRKPPKDYHQEGYYDGQQLAYSIQVANHLKACYVPVPTLPDDTDLAKLED
jgi:hypothetical protein